MCAAQCGRCGVYVTCRVVLPLVSRWARVGRGTGGRKTGWMLPGGEADRTRVEGCCCAGSEVQCASGRERAAESLLGGVAVVPCWRDAPS